MKMSSFYIPPILREISQILSKHGVKTVVVGGSIRDHFLGIESGDFDLEVYGVADLAWLQKQLSGVVETQSVGKSFGVLKFRHNNCSFDIALSRREEKCGSGHRGFTVTFDPDMEYADSSRRRDFTINSMGYDIESAELLDPHGGLKDLENRVLREVDASTFVEDPLRVYRAVQLCARFDLKPTKECEALCCDMVQRGALEELSKERIYEEFKKLLLKSPKPSIGFELMRSFGVLRYFPELEAIIGVPQDPKWHPEGDVWIHTMMSIDVMAKERSGDEKLDLKLMFAILCHDLGKATTTTIHPNWVSAKKHEIVGVGLSELFMYRLCDEHSFVESILPLVRHHLAPTQLFNQNSKAPAIRRLATKVNIEELVQVARADSLGRTTTTALEGSYVAGDWLLEMAKKLDVKNRPLPNLLKGRDLIELGYTPSKLFGEILHTVYEMQLSGDLKSKNEALEYVKNNFGTIAP